MDQPSIISVDSYRFEDYRDAFLCAIEASIQRKGIFLAEAGAFKVLADNAHGVAQAAAQRLFQEYQLHQAKAVTQTKRAGRSSPVSMGDES